MKRIKKPLNRNAVKAANDDFYDKHPEMVENGKRKPIEPRSPAHAKYRHEWVHTYVSNGGAIESNDVNNKPANSPTQPCPLQCKITNITATCSHGRQPDAKGLLEVVPAEVGDVITYSAKYENECGTHPQWEVIDNSHTISKKYSGVAGEFRAMGWTFGLPQWLADVAPQTYKITADSCSGKRIMLVKAYPSDKLNAKIDGKMWRSAKEKLDYVIDNVLAKYFKDPKFQFLEGSLEANAGWEEHPNDYMAYYKYDVSVGFNPFIGGKIRIPFGPSATLPEWMKKYGDAYMFAEFSGGISINGHWGRKTPNDTKAWVDLKGQIQGKIGASLFLMDPRTVKVEVAGGTGIFISAEADENARIPTVATEFQWDGIKGDITIVFGWGIVEFRHEYIVVKGGRLHENPYLLEIPKYWSQDF